MQKASSININLAKNRGESFVDRLVGFALTIGRLLIIGTEAVALGAFLYRFSLDQTLVTLHDKIVQQEAVVNLLHDNELLFRNLQNRLHIASTLVQQSNALPSYLVTIVAFTPPDMTIHSIAVATDAVRIEAEAKSVDALTSFVDKLKAYPPIQSVSIDRINNQTETATITVDITANLKQATQALPASQNTAQGGSQ